MHSASTPELFWACSRRVPFPLVGFLPGRTLASSVSSVLHKLDQWPVVGRAPPRSAVVTAFHHRGSVSSARQAGIETYYPQSVELQLDKHTWTVVGPLAADESGFGRVYEINSETGEDAVAKVVPKASGAQRELLIGDSIQAAGYRNVIPILDSGEHQESWILVMPRAERSLAQLLQEQDLLDLNASLVILKDIATALAEIDSAIVHRDLKPANILFHAGRWKVADFGISRYANAATSDDTRKFSFTAPYAAPEQWEYRHATGATDVYAFGIIAYELLAGERPFVGPAREDYRGQHLNAPAPELKIGPAKLRYLIEECLDKDPELRPKSRALLSRLESAGQSTRRASASKLAEVSYQHVRRHAQQQAQKNAETERLDQHRRKVQAATRRLYDVTDILEQEIRDNAPTAVFEEIVGNAAPRFEVKLGPANLRVGRIESIDGWKGPFTVLATASISLSMPTNRYGWSGRSHSLWYCDAHEEGVFSWFELAFMDNAFSSSRRSFEPFACSPHESEYALKNVVGTMQAAWPVTKIDRSEPDEFIERWLSWFADAAAGKLQRPSTMPEKHAEGTWRR